MKRNSIHLRAAPVIGLLYSITGVLTMVHVFVLFIYFWIDDEDQFDFVRLVDMDYEGNLPTLFSVLLFFLAAGLFWLLGLLCCSSGSTNKNKDRYAWFGLSGIFVFLGLDEGAKIHEHVGDFMERYVAAEGFLYFPWVIPYVVIFSVLVLIYLPFFLRRSRTTQRFLCLSAFLFLLGAVVLDSIGGWEAYQNGTSTKLYSLFYTLEEVLEMVGLIVLIQTLIRELEWMDVQVISTPVGCSASHDN
ncbi:MAG: hypothetical protein KTR18_06210 [Acidiferrobacterales bacterium]|nr:hypothetical protein [Acidiferrobacterales bacterium]